MRDAFDRQCYSASLLLLFRCNMFTNILMSKFKELFLSVFLFLSYQYNVTRVDAHTEHSQDQIMTSAYVHICFEQSVFRLLFFKHLIYDSFLGRL